jgi:hypothetical protein
VIGARFLRRTQRDERGSVLIICALLMTVLLGIAAIVVDLGLQREDTRVSRTVVDFASTAGALGIDPVFGGTPLKGCEAAWSYFISNAGLPASSTGDPCSTTFATSTVCSDSMADTTATATVGEYTVSIVTPVSDGSDFMQNRLSSDIDGTRCQRIAVQLARTRGYLFGGVFGAGRLGVLRAAVARASAHSDQGDAVSLVILDPIGCKALWVQGQAQVAVQGVGGTPGIISVDSAGTETGNHDQTQNCTNPAQDFTIDASSNVNLIKAFDGQDASGNPIPGIISSYALMPGQGNQFAYDPNDVKTPVVLTPTPTPGNRVTRLPIDWRYNCKAANGCPFAASTAPHIDGIRALYGTAGQAPTGFQTWSPSHSCSTQSNDANIVVTGNWWVNCPGSGGGSSGFSVKNWITFKDGIVVFEGDVNVNGGGLCFNMGATDCQARSTTSDSCPMVNTPTDTVVYLRNSGSFTKGAQACVAMNHTLMYLNSGIISFGAGSGALTWTAPLAGNFANLALWSESSAAHLLGGQAFLNIEGSFFTPNATPFEFKGQGAQIQTKAQFITFRLLIDGQGQLQMTADPARIPPIPLAGVQLIR